MRQEVNSYLQRLRSVEQEGIMLLVDDLMDGLGVKKSDLSKDLAGSLHGKTVAELVGRSLLEEWQDFTRQVKLGPIGLERVRSTLQLRLSESTGTVVIVDPNDVHALNFGFTIPSLPVYSRPTLSLVRSS
jgi:hypothetical protein